MKKQFKKIISIVFVILFITLTPILTYLEFENNVYAATTFEQDIESDMFKIIATTSLISYGLVFNTPNSQKSALEQFEEVLRNAGENYQSPKDPLGPKLGEAIKKMLKGTMVIVTADQLYKEIIEISDLFAELVKSFVDMNYDVGDNVLNEEISLNGTVFDITNAPLGQYFVNNISIKGGTHIFYVKNNNYVFYLKMNIDGTSAGSKCQMYYKQYYNDDWILINNSNLNFGYEVSYYKFPYIRNDKVVILNGITSDGKVYENSIVNANSSNPRKYLSSIGDDATDYEESTIIGTDDIVDNPSFDWTNTQTQTREVVVPLKTDETGLPQKDETGIWIPGIGLDEWIGVTPPEIPNMDPSGEPIYDPGTLPENPTTPENPPSENPTLPENPPLPENPTLPELQNFTIIEYLKEIFKKNNQDMEMTDPTIMGMPSADGTGGGGTGTPTAFEWGDFKNFFDIFFIFIYFIVILILILVKFLQVVFNNLPSIPPNTELFNSYPTILDGVNYIKNLRVGGLSITVQQAFEYVFLVFFFIFVLKQIRKLYGASVYEENHRTTVESGIKSNQQKSDSLNDIRNNPNSYENIKFTDYKKGR